MVRHLLFCYFSVISYYPLYPPHDDVNIDYDQFDVHARLPCTPHVLIVPSDLRYFIKVRHDVTHASRTDRAFRPALLYQGTS